MRTRTKLTAVALASTAALSVAVTAHAATINGNDSANYLHGTDYADTINGYGGNDTIRAYGGDDRVDGGAGKDLLYGGLGNDYINNGWTYMDDVIYAGGGNDYIRWNGHPSGLIDCGGGYDTISVLDKPRTVSCEKVIWR